MKKLLLTLLITLLVIGSSLGQNTRNRVILDGFMSFSKEEGADKWAVHTERKEVFFVSLFDLEKLTFTIFSNNTQKYQFVKILDRDDEELGLVSSFLALDQDDDLCYVHLYEYEEFGFSSYHIEYGDFLFIYFVKKD